MITFPNEYSSPRMKTMISIGWVASSNQGRSHLPHNFGSSYEYLIHY